MIKVLRLFPFLLVGFIFFSGCSGNLFYMPRQYSESAHLKLLSDHNVVQISYLIEEDRQTAYYVGNNTPPEQLWVLFSGINSLALDWHQWIYQAVSEKIGFLLVDFPGYGLNEGTPRAEKMSRSAVAAYDALVHIFQIPPGEHLLDINVMGHSLGTGVAVDFATKMPTKKLLLIAPFTNLEELVLYRYGVFQGSFLNLINPEQYQSDDKLKMISAKIDPPEIIIIHGVDDVIIPVEMGRAMAGLSPALTTYYELADTGHKNIFAEHLELILKIIQGN